MQKLERLRELLAHKNFDGTYSKLIELMADIALKKLEPEIKNAALPKPELSKPTRPNPTPSTSASPKSARPNAVPSMSSLPPLSRWG